MPGILVVEDDENLNRGITFSLKNKIFSTILPRKFGRSWKRVVQESDFFYREKLSKNTEVQSW